MNLIFETWIAFRYLKSRQQEGFISVVSLFSFLGITLGVATLIIVMSVMNGFREEMLNKILGLNGHAYIPIESDNSEVIKNLTLEISDVEGVVNVEQTVQSTVMISSNYSSTGVSLKGVIIEDLIKRDVFKINLTEETLNNFVNPNTVLLGKKLANKLRVNSGDVITIISPRGINTPFGSAPNAKFFSIAGTFDLGMYEYDTSVVIMKIEDSRELLGLNEKFLGMVELFFIDPDEANNITNHINNIANKYGFNAIPWTKRFQQFFGALKVERNVMFIILALIILVAAFNVVSSMIMLVKDKENSISILRTIGISRYSILRVFIIVGSFIGILGTFLGCLAGIIFSLNIEKIQSIIEHLIGGELFVAEIYFLSNVPSKINYNEVFWLVLLSLILSFLSTIYPAWRASSIDPAKVLRYG